MKPFPNASPSLGSLHIDAARSVFEENFALRGELGASVSVWNDGNELVHFAGGHTDRERSTPWTSLTRVLVWSATKGLSAACVLHAINEASLPLDTPVTHLWPAFGAAGKDRVTLRMLLHHQAGLCALDRSVPVEDREAVSQALAEQPPAWEPGTAQGYHPRTFGYLLDEIVRRVSGVSISAYWRTVFAEPLALDFWIGLPEHLLDDVAPIFAPKTTLPKEDPFLAAFMTPGSLTARAFASPRGLHSASTMNEPAARKASYPGWGGIGSASALAKFYAMLANDGCFQGRRYFSRTTLDTLRSAATQGIDRVLLLETAFQCGWMQDPLSPDGSKRRTTFGPSPTAFGHPGAGGSVAFADPSRGIGCAYVMNQMEPGVLPNPKSNLLWNALLQHP